MRKFKAGDLVRFKPNMDITGAVEFVDESETTFPYLVDWDCNIGRRWESEDDLEFAEESEPDTHEYTLDDFTNVELAEELLRRMKL